MDSIVLDLRCSRLNCMHSFFFFFFPYFPLTPTHIQAHGFEYIIHTHSGGQWLNKKQDSRPDLLSFLCLKTDVTTCLKHTCCIYQARAAADGSWSVYDICVSLSPHCICKDCSNIKKRHVKRGWQPSVCWIYERHTVAVSPAGKSLCLWNKHITTEPGDRIYRDNCTRKELRIKLKLNQNWRCWAMTHEHNVWLL